MRKAYFSSKIVEYVRIIRKSYDWGGYGCFYYCTCFGLYSMVGSQAKLQYWGYQFVY